MKTTAEVKNHCIFHPNVFIDLQVGRKEKNRKKFHLICREYERSDVYVNKSQRNANDEMAKIRRIQIKIIENKYKLNLKCSVWYN